MFTRIRRFVNKTFFLYLAKKVNNVEYQLIREDFIRRGLLEIGEHTYGNINILRNKGSDTKISIGKYCSIASDVIFITGGIHPIDWVSTYPFRIKWGLDGAYKDGMPTTKGPINIGHDVWISTGVTIMSGVSIGNGAIVAANSLVAKDVPSYAIVAGVPAKILRYRFDKTICENLEKITWWLWSEDKIRMEVDILSSRDIDEFIEKHYYNNGNTISNYSSNQ